MMVNDSTDTANPEPMTPAEAATSLDTATPTSKMDNLVNRLRHDRGAVLVEAAICIPLLLLVIMGAVEAGLAWESKSATVSGVRTGTLRASVSADAPETDLLVLRSIVGEVGADNADRIENVVIFEASGDAQMKFDQCLAGGNLSPCVIYDNSVIDSVVDGTLTIDRFDDGGGLAADGLSYTCDGMMMELDELYCAGSRTIFGDSTIGVAITYNHEWFTGILPFGPPQFQEFVVSSTFTDGGANIAAGAVVPPGPTGPMAFTGPFNFVGGPYNGTVPGVNFSASNGASVAGGTSPNGEEFFGPFQVGHSATIDITGQMPGAEVCVDFDLLVIRSWDRGTNDRFQATIAPADGTGVSDTRGEQVYGTSNNPGATADTNRLGYTGSRSWHRADSTIPYNDLCAIADANGAVTLTLESFTDRDSNGDGIPDPQGVNDESWALDDITISVTGP